MRFVDKLGHLLTCLWWVPILGRSKERAWAEPMMCYWQSVKCSVGYRYFFQVSILFDTWFRYQIQVLIPGHDTHLKESILFDTSFRYQSLSIDTSFDTFRYLQIFEFCTGNFCMAKYYFWIKINQESPMKHKNEFSDF